MRARAGDGPADYQNQFERLVVTSGGGFRAMRGARDGTGE